MLASRAHKFRLALPKITRFKANFRTATPVRLKPKQSDADVPLVSETWQEIQEMDFHQLDEWCTQNTYQPRKKNKIPPLSPRKRMFKDSVRIHLRAGNGGPGIVSFQREAHKRVGPPSGGNGGDGGDIIIRAVDMEPNLSHLKHFHGAGAGGAGRKDQKRGKNGNTVFLNVPLGTVVTQHFPKHVHHIEDELQELAEMDYHPNDVETILEEEGVIPKSSSNDENVFSKRMAALDQQYNEEEKLSYDEPPTKKQVKPASAKEGEPISVDLCRPGEYFIAAEGGRGGSGNRRFKSGSNRSPKEASSGTPGQSRWYDISLKMIAQIGLVGLPNAGKSSFLAAISNATPKIANYPFTTITPSIGTLQWIDSYSLSMADLPGLIEGAHLNRGLGHQFLKHIERTLVLCFVIDMSDKPWDHLMLLQQELQQYKTDLLNRASLIVANKMDLPQSAANLDAFKKSLAESELQHLAVFPVSALCKTDIDPLKQHFRTMVEEMNAEEGWNKTDFVAVDLSARFQRAFEDEDEDQERE